MVRHPDLGVVRARVVNCSADGLLVEWERSAPAKRALVTLAEATLFRLQGRMFRLKALVVHSRDGRAGLMFAGGRDQREMSEALLASLERGTLAPPAAGTNATEWVGRAASAGF